MQIGFGVKRTWIRIAPMAEEAETNEHDNDHGPTANETLYLPSKVLNRDHFHFAFNTNAYLHDFYSKVDEPAMQVKTLWLGENAPLFSQLILTYLPTIVHRLPKGGKLLDLGAGPTIHVPVAFRNAVDEVRKNSRKESVRRCRFIKRTTCQTTASNCSNGTETNRNSTGRR